MQHRLTATEVVEVAARLEELVRSIVVEAISRLPEERTCPCARALEGARLKP